MKTIELNYLPGDQVWIKGQYRVCYIDQVIIDKTNNGNIETTYTWYNLDVGVDVTELWDEGDFTAEDIGKTVFSTYEELADAYPEEYKVEYNGDEFSY